MKPELASGIIGGIFTDREIRDAKSREKDCRLSDEDGLYLVVKTTGGKLWRWSYEFNGEEKLLSYGPYTLVSLAEIRQSHKSARTLKSPGIDPATEKQIRKRSELESETASMPAFGELVEE